LRGDSRAPTHAESEHPTQDAHASGAKFLRAPARENFIAKMKRESSYRIEPGGASGRIEPITSARPAPAVNEAGLLLP
jgi:hypothetical protein